MTNDRRFEHASSVGCARVCLDSLNPMVAEQWLAHFESLPPDPSSAICCSASTRLTRLNETYISTSLALYITVHHTVPSLTG